MDIEEDRKILLETTPHIVSSDRRAYVQGYPIHKDPETGRMYTLVSICQGIYKSGSKAGELCLNPAGIKRYTCSAHRKQEIYFVGEPDPIIDDE